MKVIYEWVAERKDDNGDIYDCRYFGEGEGAKACADFRDMVAEAEAGGKGGADFGLCRRVVDPVDGDLERSYAYVEADFLGGFDDGREVPQRLRREFASFWGAR